MQVSFATYQHDAALLQLLEENEMSGSIKMVLTRRPGYFHQQHYYGQEYPVICTEQHEALGMCQLTLHQGFANGKPCQLGYLNSLRITRSARHRLSIIKAGFKFIKEQLKPPHICYTSITSDNLPARRLLEKGLNELPRYHFLGELCTLAVSTKSAKRRNLWQLASFEEYPAIIDFYHQHVMHYQLAPQLHLHWLISTNLPVLVFYQKQHIAACAIIWNQQAFKQVMATHYSPVTRILRPAYNMYASLSQRVKLPAIGQPLDQSMLAFFACQHQDIAPELISDAMNYCNSNAITFGIMADDPLLVKLTKQFNPLIYRTRLYQVDFDSVPDLQNYPLKPEVAIL